jgi:hypothetical protein
MIGTLLCSELSRPRPPCRAWASAWACINNFLPQYYTTMLYTKYVYVYSTIRISAPLSSIRNYRHSRPRPPCRAWAGPPPPPGRAAAPAFIHMFNCMCARVCVRARVSAGVFVHWICTCMCICVRLFAQENVRYMDASHGMDCCAADVIHKLVYLVQLGAHTLQRVLLGGQALAIQTQACTLTHPCIYT